MCLFNKRQARFLEKTPMLLPAWNVDTQFLEPDKQQLAMGSWMQPTICGGRFGQAPSLHS